MKINLKDSVEYWMQRHLVDPMICILCGKRAKWMGAYVPSKEIQNKFKGLANSKTRRFLYGLCKRHKPSEQIALLAEAQILKDHKQGLATDITDEVREHKRKKN